MIKNQKQASITKEKLLELKKAKEEFEQGSIIKTDAKYELGIKSFDGLISDLEHQLNEYDSLVNGSFHCLKPNSLQEIPKILIAARLAQKISQKELGQLVGIKEQQIQRYEISDYETASWLRIIEISLALGIKFLFEKVIVLNTCEDNVFEIPEGISKTQVELFESKVKKEGSLIIQ